MKYELTKMQENIRAEFETVLEFVTSKEAQTATADQIERGLFRLLLSLGSQLLCLFFQMRAQGCCRDEVMTATGQMLAYHSEQKRVYFSIFGKVPVWRPYFYAVGLGGQTPLDAELSLGSDRYSDLLRETLAYLGVYTPYHKTVAIFKRILGLGVSTRVQKELVATDATDVPAYYAQKPAPAAVDEAEILVIQADGKGVPMILEEVAEPQVRLGKGQKRGRKKEAIVTTVYTIAALPRTAKAVVASFFHQDEADKQAKTTLTAPPKPQNKHVWATLDGKEAALSRLARQVEARQGSHIHHRVALADGCESLQEHIKAQFPDFTLVLDFIHANEYLWKVANSLWGETNGQRTQWVADQTLLMLSGQTEQLIADLRTLAQAAGKTPTQVEKLTKTANYFQRNLAYMDYPTYLAQGWPIASGVVEGACRHFVKDRFELSGMRWDQSGAENLLHLRAVAENGDWDDYHLFRRQQRHQRLYAAPLPTQHPLETLALEMPATIQPLASETVDNLAPAHDSSSDLVPSVAVTTTLPRAHDYHALPLAV